MMLFAVQSLREVLTRIGNRISSSVPMCNISLVHKSEALCQAVSGLYVSDQVMHESHITYLCEEGHELAKGLEPGLIKAAQVRHYNQFLIKGQFKDF
jgi:hypothetical protein